MLAYKCLALLSLSNTVSSAALFTERTIPRNLTEACSASLLSDVDCSPLVASLEAGSHYSDSILTRTCTANCAASLSRWQVDVTSSCSGQSWSGYHGKSMPLEMIPDMMHYSFNLSCITDQGRFCNAVAAQAAYASDPPGDQSSFEVSVASRNETAAPVDPCDICLIKNLQFQAGSPYFDGPSLATVYSEKTSSCSVTAYPVKTSSTFAFYSPTASPVAFLKPDRGKNYTIKPGDNCFSISKAQSIGTAWLLTDNALTAYCKGFPTSGVLQLRNTCDVATVHHDQTCTGISKANNITIAQLLAWNPVISSDCHNIARLNGTSLCISSPGMPYSRPATVESPASPFAAAVPSDVANGTNHVCGRYYKVKPRDYCNLLVMKFGISLSDFRFLNSGINSNCTNLFSEESYCVKPAGDINDYSGRSGYASTGIKATLSFAPFSDIPLASKTTTISSPRGNISSTALPLAKGTRSDCNFYFNGGTFQGNSTFYSSQCELAANVYNVEIGAFSVWNKAINASDPSCTFDPASRYCGRLYVVGKTVGKVPDQARLTTASFASRSKSVPTHMTTLTQSTAVASSAVVTPTPTATYSPAPRRGNESVNCSKWHTVLHGDSCSSVSMGYSIKLDDFYKWNPKVDRECEFGFWFGFAYCVGTA